VLHALTNKPRKPETYTIKKRNGVNITSTTKRVKHNRERNFIKSMAEAVEEIKKGKDEKFKFIENAKGYIILLKDHFYKEDNIIFFNMADMHLSQEVQNGLLEKFEKFEKEEIGEGVHEKNP